MTQRYREIAFTPAVSAAQRLNGGTARDAAARPDASVRDRLTEAEMAFIQARDSFYMATMSASGWPYVQHRGGPTGFVRILGPDAFGIADYRGNRQYLTVGNLDENNRASLFFMDYPNRRRLKVLAYARVVTFEDDPDLIAKLSDSGYRAKVERGLVFDVEAFDWNCPQHIMQRFTSAELEALLASRPDG
ncbi:MAG: pyridoxamine 5'-phosphate oxidase family protein [Alphaproteobacteria bacterium]|nr:pyridoxamine 5'-phosphate oxidase family protein [Alphaproteobacteria bacterium]